MHFAPNGQEGHTRKLPTVAALHGRAQMELTG